MQIFNVFLPGIRAHEHLQVIHAPLFLVSQYAVGSIYFHKLKENVGENLTLKILLCVRNKIVKYTQADTSYEINFTRNGANKVNKVDPFLNGFEKTGTGT
jgi:hypothetical protein